MKSKVEGHSNLYKDDDSGVISNRADGEREKYRIAKQRSIDNIKTKEDLESVKEELDNIKHLLKQLIK
jgi:hypothetical protein